MLPVNIHAEAPTDEELKALEQQIEQQETEQVEAKKRAEAETKRKVEEETKRRAEEERLRAEEEAKRQAESEQQRAAEEESRRLTDDLEKQRLADEDRKRIQEEAKRLVEEELKRKEEEANRPSVTVIFFRPWQFGFGEVMSILSKGREIGVLPVSSFFTYLSPSGEQSFTTGYVGYSGFSSTQNYELEPDKTYYIKAAAKFGGAYSQLVTEAEGAEAIKGYTDSNLAKSGDAQGNQENTSSKNPFTGQ